ncbi:MAG: amino acid adenylation domain-containing protein [Cyanobacteria bacterium P01_F01_bin.150]
MRSKCQGDGSSQRCVQALSLRHVSKNNLPVLSLPCDSPRPSFLEPETDRLLFQMPKALTTRLQSLAQQKNTTLDIFLLTAFHLFLSRYSSQEEVCVGFMRCDSTQLDRASGLAELDALLEQLIVIKASLANNPSFDTVLVQAHQAVLEALRVQENRFDSLVQNWDDIQPNRHPICQARFIFQSGDGLSKTLDKNSGTPREVALSAYAPFDLTLRVDDGTDVLQGSFIYPPALFNGSTIERMAANFQALLTGIVSNCEQSVGYLPLLSDAERQQVLVDWNNTAIDYPSDRCIHQLFEEQAKRTPEAIAVTFNDQSLTYRDLNQRANQLAHYLQEHGIGPNVLVGICMERSLEMLVGLMGVFKAGGAYLPLDPHYPKDRLSYMLSDANVTTILSQQHLKHLLSSYAQVVCLDTQWTEIAIQPIKNPNYQVESHDLAYVIYTSGSTGNPKGVRVAHQGLCNLAYFQKHAFNVDIDSRIFQFASLNFDASIWEIVMAFGAGASLYLRRHDALLPGPELNQWLVQKRITHATLPPSVLSMMPSDPLPGLRTLIVAGEACSPTLVSQWSKERQFVNAYGPTESTVCATMVECYANDAQISIGKPIANTQVYILDRYLNPVPIGIPGELHIGGDGLALGYHNRPDLTAEKFIGHPFSEKLNARLYKTGDLGRYRPDGNIEFLGRIDHQVKIRGFRIEIGEIETLLNHHAQVNQSLVMINDEQLEAKHLMAYIVPQDNLETMNQAKLTELEEAQVYAWQEVSKGIYTQNIGITDPLFNSAGWLNSHNNQPIPEQQMRHWASEVVGQVLAHNPEQVWEIGCGTGMLLFQIAPHCKAYYGTDLSHVSLNYIEQQISQQVNLQGDPFHNVILEQRFANNFQGIEGNSIDLILLNSIIQHFPSLGYLLDVLEGAIRVLKPGGLLFLGDIRSFPLLRTFHAFVQHYQAGSSDTRLQLQQNIEREILQETELCIAPDFFVALKDKYPKISHVQIRLQGGEHNHEMNKYRYSVLIHIESKKTSITASDIINAHDFKDADIRQYLIQQQPDSICFSQLVNPRLVGDRHIIDLLKQPEITTVADLNQALDTDNSDTYIGVDQLRQLAAELGYDVEICWSDSQSDGAMDAVFVRSELARDAIVLTPLTQRSVSIENLQRYGNNPLNSQVSQDLIPELKTYLKQRLPDYMIPSAFMLLPEFPLTPNGKIDRRALPIPKFTELASANFVAPQTETERQLAAIWADVLNLEQVGIQDNFFDLGGHSLLATKVTSRIRQQFEIELSVNTLFDHSTISQLADVVTTEKLTQIDDDILEQLLAEVDG